MVECHLPPLARGPSEEGYNMSFIRVAEKLSFTHESWSKEDTPAASAAFIWRAALLVSQLSDHWGKTSYITGDRFLQRQYSVGAVRIQLLRSSITVIFIFKVTLFLCYKALQTNAFFKKSTAGALWCRRKIEIKVAVDWKIYSQPPLNMRVGLHIFLPKPNQSKTLVTKLGPYLYL